MSSRSIIFVVFALIALAHARWPAYRERMSEMSNLAENSAENNEEFKNLEERNGRINPFNLDDGLFKSVMDQDAAAVDKELERIQEETSGESSEDRNAFPQQFQMPRGMVILPARIVETEVVDDSSEEDEVRSPIVYEQIKGVVLTYQPENNDDDSDENQLVYANEIKPIGVERIEFEPENTNLETSNEQETNENEDNLSYKIILPNDANDDQEEQNMMDRPMNDQAPDDDDDDDNDNNNQQTNERNNDNDDDQQQQNVDETHFATY